MSARSSRFSGCGSNRGRGKSAGAAIVCAVMLLAGCGGSEGAAPASSAPAGGTMAKGVDVAAATPAASASASASAKCSAPAGPIVDWSGCDKLGATLTGADMFRVTSAGVTSLRTYCPSGSIPDNYPCTSKGYSERASRKASQPMAWFSFRTLTETTMEEPPASRRGLT